MSPESAIRPPPFVVSLPWRAPVATRSVAWLLFASALAGCRPDGAWTCVIPSGTTPDSSDRVGCRSDFEILASRPVDETIPGARSSKTLIDRSDGDALYFTNSNRYPVHFDFASARLSGVVDPAAFAASEYYSASRRFLLGAVTHYEEPDVWAYEIAPYDSASAGMVADAVTRIAADACFGPDLYFHPTSAAQEALVLPDTVRVVTTDQIYAGITYQPLNLGESYGQLRRISASALAGSYVGLRDVVVLDSVPNDISVVAGIVTSDTQTPLSHVNVLSQNRGTPNMALRGAYDDPRVVALDGGWVHLVVDAFGYTLEAATADEADAWWAGHRPEPVGVPPMDLTVTELRDVRELDPSDVAAFGGKATGYGVLSRLGEEVQVQPAFAVPIFYYDQFETQNGFDVRIARLEADPRFRDDALWRQEALAALRADMLTAPVDPQFEALLVQRLQTDLPGERADFRSSTNAEDLAGFSGAGLYSSTSGALDDPDDTVLDAVRATWASLWNDRAWEERSYYGIPQDSVGMALLVTPAFTDEEANGVALTANMFDAAEPAFYVNMQVGENSVVSPWTGITVDSFLLYWDYPGQPVAWLSYSNLMPPDERVASDAQIQELGRALSVIHDAFAPYWQVDGAFYAMDVEFKFDDHGSGDAAGLWVKQARPHDGWAGE